MGEQELNIKKKRTLVTLALVLILVSLMLGISYAAWSYVFVGNTNTIATSNVSIEFLESNSDIINITNALPMSDEEGIAQEETFDFAVTTTSTNSMPVSYSLVIQKQTVDTGYYELDDNDINIYLTDYSGNKLDTLCNDATEDGVAYIQCFEDYEFYTAVHNHDSSHQTIQDKFKLRAWLYKDVDASDWDASTKLQYKFKIGVKSPSS